MFLPVQHVTDFSIEEEMLVELVVEILPVKRQLILQVCAIRSI